MKKNAPFTLLLIIIALCFLLPNNNTSIDSWFYAASVKHNHDLFNNSHHLLYNFFAFKTWQFLNLIYPVSALKGLLLLNAFAASVSLFLFSQIIKLAGYSSKNALILTAFCGASFGFLRFATDAETYILPLMWTFGSAYFYIKSDKPLYTALASFFAVIAVCTHQLQIWWALAMFIHIWFLSKRKLGSQLLFSSILLLIPVIYFQTYVMGRYCNISVTAFILGEYSTGGAGLDVSLKALLLTIVNFFRTFLQVHGQIIFLLKKYPYLSLAVIASLIKIIIFVILKSREIIIIQKRVQPNNFALLFLLTFVFNLVFAFLSSGNAEFMVMLPFMMMAYIAFKYEVITHTRSLLIVLFMLIWNLFTGILPSCFENLTQTDVQSQLYINQPEAYFVFENKPQVENQVCYTKNFESNNHFITADQIQLYLDSGKTVYTDFGIKTTALSRASFLKDEQQNDILKNFKLIKTDSFQNLYGKNYIYLISKKDE